MTDPTTPVPSPSDPVGPDPSTLGVEWNGRTWSVPASSEEWPFQAAEALERNQGVAFLRAVLGPVQMREFERGDRTKVRDATELFRTIVDATGARSAGESPAS